MNVEAEGDSIRVHVGPAFGNVDVVRLRQTLMTLGAFSNLSIDFGSTRQCDDAALVDLARLLRSLPGTGVALRGLTLHQSRLLEHVGLSKCGVLAPESTDSTNTNER